MCSVTFMPKIMQQAIIFINKKSSIYLIVIINLVKVLYLFILTQRQTNKAVNWSYIDSDPILKYY